MSKRHRALNVQPSPVGVRGPASVANGMASLVQAQQSLAAGKTASVRDLLKPALADPSLRPEALYLSAITALMDDLPTMALEAAREAVAARPKDPRYLLVLGRSLKAAGDLSGAESSYRLAIDLKPSFVDAMVSLGIVLKNTDRVDDAIEIYERALSLSPRMAAAFANLSNALALRAEKRAKETHDEKPDEDSLNAVGRAVALDLKNPKLHQNYGVLLARASRHHEAIAAFNEVLTLDPGSIEACLRLGDELVAIGASGMARQAYEKWLDTNPPSAPVMRALASVLTRSGEIDAALEWSEKVLAIDADGNALMTLAGALMQARRQIDALTRHREAIVLTGGLAVTYSGLVMGLNYVAEEPNVIFAAHAEFGSRLAPVVDRPQWRDRPAGTRLRIGYVSGDFVNHSVSHFIEGLFEHRDRSRFEVFCYHNTVVNDSVTARLKSHGQNWFECHGMSDEGLRRQIIEDEIDLLVDLSGHTAHARFTMFAMGAAPVQLSYLGYPTISGVPAIDFRVTDSVIDPGDMPPVAAEQPICLPRTMFCFRPDPAAPALAPPPAQVNGYVTFGSFNNIAKVTDHTLEIWAQAMSAVSGSRLLLKSGAMAQATNRGSIEAFFERCGISRDRLMLQPWNVDKHGHLSVYNEVDIALDPFPYNGATTTCEALWMGVPVVTRRGITHTSRMGASILSAIGREQWIADSDDEFVAIAKNLAGDLPGLAAWRAIARERLNVSPLLDQRGFAHDFEAVLERAWQMVGARAALAS